MKLRSVAVAITAVLFSFALQAQNADEILSKYFTNTGGLDNWKKLTSITSTGKAFMGQEFPMVVYEKAPNKQKMVINVQGTELIPAAYDGTTAWSLNPFAGGKDASKMDDEQAKEIKDEEFQDDFIDYKKKGHEVTLGESEEVDGVKCFKLTLVRNKNNDREDITEIFYFDQEDYVPIVVIRYVRSGPQKGTEVKTYLSDYQESGGLMFPYSMEQKVNGQVAFKMTLEKIITNDISDDSIFAFPKK